MKRKRVKVLLFCFLILGSVSKNYAQEVGSSSEATIKSIAQKMFVDINNKDFDAILEMTHPKVYDLVPKEQMKSVLVTMFEGTEEFSIEIPKIIPEYKLSKVFKVVDENLEYAFISYDMRMEMTFHNQDFDEDAKEMMIPMMKAQGMEVEFISNNAMKILMKDRLTIIVKDNSTNNKWAMVNYDPDSPLFFQILPSSLIEISKEYKQSLMLESKKENEN